jgi:putative Ca2+/H+ antiporter (TMEM165/GDT1 family)
MDGAPVPVYPANLVNRAVSVSAGKCVIEFVYHPNTVHHDITMVGSFLVFAVIVYDASNRRRRRKDAVV